MEQIPKTCDSKMAFSAAIQRKGATRCFMKNLIKNRPTSSRHGAHPEDLRLQDGLLGGDTAEGRHEDKGDDHLDASLPRVWTSFSCAFAAPKQAARRAPHPFLDG